MDPVIETVFVKGVFREERRNAKRNATSFSRRSTDNALILSSVKSKIDMTKPYFRPLADQLGRNINIFV